MQDTYLGQLLERVIAGDEFAYRTFLKNRLAPSQQCNLLEMLAYIVEQAQQRNSGLGQCYPEALVELAYFIADISKTDDDAIKKTIAEFVELLRNAAYIENNPGAQAAILIMRCAKLFIHLLPVSMLETESQSLEHMDKHQLYLLSKKYALYSITCTDVCIKKFMDKKALNCLKQADAKGHIFSKNELGKYYLKKAINNDVFDIDAFNYFNDACELGVAEAMFNLAEMHDTEGFCESSDSLSEKLNDDSNVNDQIAFRYYQNAADLGLPQAMVNLGYYYKYKNVDENNGMSFEERKQQAAAWFNAAKKLGEVEDADFYLSELNIGSTNSVAIQPNISDVLWNDSASSSSVGVPPLSSLANSLHQSTDVDYSCLDALGLLFFSSAFSSRPLSTQLTVDQATGMSAAAAIPAQQPVLKRRDKDDKKESAAKRAMRSPH